MTNNVTERTVKETVTAGADVLFSAEVSLGKAGVESQERMPKLGTDAFAVQCRNLDHRSLAYRFIKRIFDFMFSVCVVVIGFLPGLILSLAIVVDTKGSPIYSQARIGRLGQTFRIYKFRTMVADSDDVEKHLDADQLAQWHRERKVDDDPRITPLGRKLRRLSLDEVPNFLNVLKGDIPLRILKTRPEFSEKSMGAFALPAKSSTNKGEAFSQVVSCFASGLRMRRISGFNCKRVGSMGGQFLTKPVFKAVCA